MKKLLLVLSAGVLLVSVLFVAFSCSVDIQESPEMYYVEDSSYGLYFYGENHNLENEDMVRAAEAVKDDSYFDSSKPTIIWVHGWEQDYAATDRLLTISRDTFKEITMDDISYPEAYRALGYNVATFCYEGDGETENYAANLQNIYNYAFGKFLDSGESLAFLFASELCITLGDSYSKEITYIGHSCGSFMTLAINNMVDYFYENGATSNKNLIAANIYLADPYVNTLYDKAINNNTVYLTGEDVTDVSKVQLCQKIISRLHKKYSTAISIYLGMTIASSSFIKVSEEEYEEVADHCVVVDMTGLKSKYGQVGNIHCITRDWVLQSLLNEKLLDQNGDVGPSAALSKSEMLALVGNEYEQVLNGFDLSSDSLNKVDSLFAGKS